MRIYLIYQKTKRYKKFALQFALKFLTKISCFVEEARKCAFHFVDSHIPEKICVICFIESPLKMMENAFYFHLKTSFRSQDI